MFVSNANTFNISEIVGESNLYKYSKDDFICTVNFSGLVVYGDYKTYSISGITQPIIQYDSKTGDVIVTPGYISCSLSNPNNGSMAKKYTLSHNVYLCTKAS